MQYTLVHDGILHSSIELFQRFPEFRSEWTLTQACVYEQYWINKSKCMLPTPWLLLALSLCYRQDPSPSTEDQRFNFAPLGPASFRRAMSPTWVNASVSTEVSPFRSSPKLEQQEKQEKFDDDLKEIFMLGSRTGGKRKGATSGTLSWKNVKNTQIMPTWWRGFTDESVNTKWIFFGICFFWGSMGKGAPQPSSPPSTHPPIHRSTHPFLRLGDHMAHFAEQSGDSAGGIPRLYHARNEHRLPMERRTSFSIFPTTFL